MARRFNYRRVKIHHPYTIAQAAEVLRAHKQTVSRWIAAGLPVTTDKRPFLIHGSDLRAFLQARQPIKQRCQPGEFYCLGCRAPKRPAGNMADYLPRRATRGALGGICPSCGKMIYRAINRARIEQISGGLDIAFPKAERRLSDSSNALLNVVSEQDQRT
jgi:excisionase family DNA binding protein